MSEGQVFRPLAEQSNRLAQMGIDAGPGRLAYWIKEGCMVRGRRVFLAGTRLGRKWYVTDAAIRDFASALTYKPEPAIATRPQEPAS